VIGGYAGKLAKVSEHNRRTLFASLAGAGLGVAFGAPLGGVLFVFEEVARAGRTRLVLIALIGLAVAVAMMQLIIGRKPIARTKRNNTVTTLTHARLAS
jgi:CIC family chloride channel protein